MDLHRTPRSGKLWIVVVCGKVIQIRTGSSTVNCDFDVGSQPSDSRTRERRKLVVDTERQEPRVGNQEDGGGLDILLDRLRRSMQEEIRKRDRPPTGGPVCFSCGDGGHKVNRCPHTDFPHLPRDGLLNLDNGQY